MIYYHGTSSQLELGIRLLPPDVTGKIQEVGRKKNLNMVFFTTDAGSARTYAGRACAKFGGSPVVYRVIPMAPVECLNSTPGSTVYFCEWAFIEPVTE